jgi:hypothetical protein
MPSGQTIHAEALTIVRRKKLFTQKDLMERWGFNNIRAVQRAREQYGLKPADFWGINPLFTPKEVEAMEKRRRERIAAELERRARNCRKLLGLKQARRIAGKRGRK